MRGSVPWAAVRTVGRSELRRNWRSMVVLGLLAGLVGAVVAAAATVALRTGTAYERLADATHLDDARVLLFADSVTPEEVEALPGVVRSWRSRQVIGQLDTAHVLYVSISAGGPRPEDLFSPVIVAGRAPRPEAPLEVILPEQLAKEAALGVGDPFPVKLLTPLEVTQFDVGFGQPDGPQLDMRVVGLFRSAYNWVGNGVGPALASPAFRQVAAGSFVGHDVMVRLRHGAADRPAFSRAVEQLDRRAATGATGGAFGTLQAAYPTSEGDPDEIAARHTLVDGLLVLLVVAAVGGLLAVGQGLGRHHAAGAADQQLEAELGLTRGERVLARLLPALLGAGLAGALTAVGALAAGAVQPLGPLKAFEPDPGYLLRPWLATAAVAAAVLAFLGLAAVTASRVVRGRATGASRSAPFTPLPRLGRRAPTLAGLAFALRRPRGRAGVPVRATALVAVCGIAGVVAVGAFAASLERLVSTPSRFGWTAHFSTVDARPDDTAQIAADPRVTALSVGDSGDLRLDGQRVNGVALHHVRGEIPLTVLSGRLPDGPGEVSVGLVTLRRLGAHVGDQVALTTYADGGGSRRLRVVGTVLLPPFTDERIGTGAIVSPADLRAGSRTQTYANALVVARSDKAAAELYSQLSQRLEMNRRTLPRQIANLQALGHLPSVLAAFLALLAAVVLAHSLVLTARRRSTDLAVLRVIGMTPREVAATVGVMAGTLTVIGLALGPVIGLALGRVVWAQVADSLGVAGDLAVPWWLLVVAVPVAVLAAVTVAVLPARRAARLSPAEVLRAE